VGEWQVVVLSLTLCALVWEDVAESDEMSK
jgi:hypothetical protein